MKKVILFLFLITILSGCKTIEYIEVPVPIEVEIKEISPERTELTQREDNETVTHFLLSRIAYYSDLVKEWESWGIYIYETLDKPLPDSLQLVKNKLESEE